MDPERIDPLSKTGFGMTLPEKVPSKLNRVLLVIYSPVDEAVDIDNARQAAHKLHLDRPGRITITGCNHPRRP